MKRLRNRIAKHARVRAGDLVPHELNPRSHPQAQRLALEALYNEIGFARSLLAYELPDGRLKLIDGHLRAELTPDEEVEVEILDVNDAEARALLLAIDPLAQLADYSAEALSQLRDLVEKESPAIEQLWANIERQAGEVQEQLESIQEEAEQDVPEQYLLLIECEDEAEQVALLERFREEGLKCKTLIS